MITSVLLAAGITKLNLSQGVSQQDGGVQVLADVQIELFHTAVERSVLGFAGFLANEAWLES